MRIGFWLHIDWFEFCVNADPSSIWQLEISAHSNGHASRLIAVHTMWLYVKVERKLTVPVKLCHA